MHLYQSENVFMTITDSCLWEKYNFWNKNEIQQTAISVSLSSQPSLSISEGAFTLRGKFLKLFGKNLDNVIREIEFIITPTDTQKKKNTTKILSSS